MGVKFSILLCPLDTSNIEEKTDDLDKKQHNPDVKNASNSSSNANEVSIQVYKTPTKEAFNNVQSPESVKSDSNSIVHRLSGSSMNSDFRDNTNSPSPSLNDSTHSTSSTKSDGVPITELTTDYEINHRLSIADFELLKVLGKGSFGKVMLVKRKYNNNNNNNNNNNSNNNNSNNGNDSKKNNENNNSSCLYALKSLRKAELIKKNQLSHTATERTILQTIFCPFLVHLQYAFQTKDKLYMVLDYVGGGELFFWMKKHKIFNEKRCRLYAAEISLGINALHEQNIVYRDLKPENILVDREGHLKLTDFGLAKGGVYTSDGSKGTGTFCGTPEYLAPEILARRGHGTGVDWWALGTLLYEMLVGIPPFFDKNVQNMYKKIMHDQLRFPKSETRKISIESQDILKRLLERSPTKRLGANGIDKEFTNNIFWKNIKFNLVYEKVHYTPEFKPPSNEEDETDVTNFDATFTKELASDSLITSNDTMTSAMEEASVFANFTYSG